MLREVTAAVASLAILIGLGAFPLCGAASAQDPTPVESTQAASVEPIADADAGSGSTQNDGAAGTSVSSSSGNATLTLSRNAVGNVDSTAPLQLVFDVRTNPGDVYTITVPESITNGTGVYTIGDSDPISAATGTVISTTDNTNHTKTFTYRFDAVASVDVNINLTLHNNYNAQPTPIEGIGTSIKSITWTYAGQQLDPVDFTQVIMPVMNPQAVTRVLPSSSTYKAIYANQDYVYQFSVGETDGIDGSADYTTGQVNSAVNYGTTIRVPVPRYFTLDESATAARNGFSDETTITQPGGASSDIVITVPKGSGRQYWQNAEPYYFVGQFKTTPPLAGEKLVADGPAVVTQTIVDPQGQKRTLTARAPAWTEYLRSGDGLVPCPSGSSECLVLSINGNNKGEKTANNLLLDPARKVPTLNFLGFSNSSASNFTDVELTIDVPSGFDATALVLPNATSTLPGLTQYRYSITLLDGTTMTGVAKPGDTITQTKDSPMRTVKLYPNMLASGAYTDRAESCTTLVSDNADCAGKSKMYLQGSLAAKYDDGTPVKGGDMIKTLFTITIPSVRMKDPQTGELVTFTQTVSNTQQVVLEEQLVAAVGTWGQQGSDKQPSLKNAGFLSTMVSVSGNPTTPYIYEPIFYYVLPCGTVYNNDPLTWPNSHGGVTGDPEVTTFQADDGRQVVKIDYTGTGYKYYTQTGATNAVYLNNEPDAISGTYPWQIYMVSPTTKIDTKADPATPPADTTYVQGADKDVYLVGQGTWTINAAKETRTTELSQGNAADMFESHTTSNDLSAMNSLDAYNDDPTLMRFAVSVSNNESQPLQHIREFVAIPKSTGDSTFALNLTGPVTFDNLNGSGTSLPSYTVRYSTQPVAFTTALGSEPSTDGYVEAADVKEWSAIQSLVIDMDTLPAATVMGRFILNCSDETLYQDAQKSVALETGLYARKTDGSAMRPLVLTGSDKGVATISVTGTSTITARLHWQVDGVDHYAALDDLTHSYANNLDEFPALGLDYPTHTSGMSSADKALIPEGYVMKDKEPTIIGDASAVYPGKGWVTGVAVPGTMTRYNYNGSVVQYELVPKAVLLSTMPITGAPTFWNPMTIALLTAGLAGFATGMAATRHGAGHQPPHTNGGR